MNVYMCCAVTLFFLIVVHYFRCHLRQDTYEFKQYNYLLNKIVINSYNMPPNEAGLAVVSPGLGMEEDIQDRFIPQVPSSCLQRAYCEEDDGRYPDDHITDLLRKNNPKLINKWTFQKAAILNSYRLHKKALPKGYESVCEMDDLLLTIKIAQHSADGKWYYVVNTPEYIQIHHAVLCKGDGSACSHIDIDSSHNNQTCQMETNEEQMHSINHNGEIHIISVPIPQCCTCIVYAT